MVKVTTRLVEDFDLLPMLEIFFIELRIMSLSYVFIRRYSYIPEHQYIKKYF